MKYPKPEKVEKKPKRIQTKMTLEDYADHAFGLFWKTIRQWQCERCGFHAPNSRGLDGLINTNLNEIPYGSLDISHFVGRSHNAARYNHLNVDVLCRRCHGIFERQKNPGQLYYVWKKSRLDSCQVNINELLRLKTEIVKLTDNDYIEMADHWISMLQLTGYEVEWFKDKYRQLLDSKI